jgi:hypothetical protein
MQHEAPEPFAREATEAKGGHAMHFGPRREVFAAEERAAEKPRLGTQVNGPTGPFLC